MKLMVQLFLALVAFQVVKSQFIDGDQFHQYGPEDLCLLKLNTDRNQLEEAFEKQTIPEDDAEIGNFFVCFWKEIGVMKEDGAINSDRLERYFRDLFFETNTNLSSLEKAALKRVVDGCRHEEGKTQIQTALKLKNCAMQKQLVN